MIEGDIDFAMYQVAARHFRPPLRLVLQSKERGAYATRPDEDSYLIKDDIDQHLGLIKVFIAETDEEEKHIHDVMKGIKLISSLSLSLSEPTAPIDFEKAKVETDFKQYIALFTIPEGRSLLTHIQYLSQQKKGTLERSQGLEMLRGGYQQLAQALAELHTKRFSPICTIGEYYWKFHMDTCRALVNSLKNYAENLPFDLGDFSDKLIRMAAAAYAKPCSAAFLHGNPIAGSISYEPFSGLLSMLDLENSFHSVDERNMPCGPSAYDYVWAEASFELQMTYIDAAHDERYDILEDFRLAYKNAMRDRYPDPQHLTFYSVLFWLPIYKALVSRYDAQEMEMNTVDRRVFRLARTRIEAVLAFIPKDKGF